MVVTSITGLNYPIIATNYDAVDILRSPLQLHPSNRLALAIFLSYNMVIVVNLHYKLRLRSDATNVNRKLTNHVFSCDLQVTPVHRTITNKLLLRQVDVITQGMVKLELLESREYPPTSTGMKSSLCLVCSVL